MHSDLPADVVAQPIGTKKPERLADIDNEESAYSAQAYKEYDERYGDDTFEDNEEEHDPRTIFGTYLQFSDFVTARPDIDTKAAAHAWAALHATRKHDLFTPITPELRAEMIETAQAFGAKPPAETASTKYDGRDAMGLIAVSSLFQRVKGARDRVVRGRNFAPGVHTQAPETLRAYIGSAGFRGMEILKLFVDHQLGASVTPEDLDSGKVWADWQEHYNGTLYSGLNIPE